MEQFFSVTRRPAHSAPIVVAAVYLGIYIYIYIYCIAIIKSNQIYLDTAYLKMTFFLQI